MPKRHSVVPLNPIAEAFDRYAALMPAVTDVRGEQVWFDLGSYVHLAEHEERLERIDWIRETLQNPEEIRRSPDRARPFREVYVAVIGETEGDPGIPFVVVVDRRIELNFWTAFPITRLSYLERLKRGELLYGGSEPVGHSIFPRA